MEVYGILFGLYALAFGLCVGSFLNVCIYRIPREESVVHPRSHCPNCGALIAWYQNIPVISWCCLRGRCAACGKPIAFRYTLVELLTGLLFLMVYMQWILPEALCVTPISARMIPAFWLVIGGLVLGTFVDFEHYIIPDRVTIGGMIAGVALSALIPEIQYEAVRWRAALWSVFGLSVGFGVLYGVAWLGEKAFKKEAMGFGDVKLLGAIGAFFGWQGALFTLMISSLFGTVVGLTCIAVGGAKLQSRLPYGPYLALGALVWMFWGEAFVAWYFSRLGLVG